VGIKVKKFQAFAYFIAERLVISGASNEAY